MAGVSAHIYWDDHNLKALFKNPLKNAHFFLTQIFLHLQNHLAVSTTMASATLKPSLSCCFSPPSSLRPGICTFSWATPTRAHSSLNGLQLRMHNPLRSPSKRSFSRPVAPIMMMVKPTIQFIQGVDEFTIPDVRLTKSRDGSNGTAIFRFDQPSVFDSSSVVGDITGLYMIDEEGVLQSTNVNARFVNGKPAGVEAKYIMRTPRDWDRFMRFMERYSNANGLQFIKS